MNVRAILGVRQALDDAAREGAGETELRPVTLRIAPLFLGLFWTTAVIFAAGMVGIAVENPAGLSSTRDVAAAVALPLAPVLVALYLGAFRVSLDDRGLRGRDALTLGRRDLRWHDVVAIRLRSGFLQVEARDGTVFRLHAQARGMARFAAFAFAFAGDATIPAIAYLDRIRRGEPEVVAIQRRISGG